MSDDDITAPWWPDDIRLVTDTDLEAKRYARAQLSDPTDYSARLVETARRSEGLETHSATIDRGLRVQLAHLIDTRQVMFSRDDFDVSYSIPPASWVNEHRFPEAEIIGADELPDDLDPEERSISFTTAEVVYEMLQEAHDQTDHAERGSATSPSSPTTNGYDTLSDIVRAGVGRLIGRTES